MLKKGEEFIMNDIKGERKHWRTSVKRETLLHFYRGKPTGNPPVL
jgi:hypothetical protein